MNIKQPQGFSLLELLVTLSIIGITMTIAIPGMNQLLKSDHLTLSSDAFFFDLMRARNEAVRSNLPVFICASSNQVSCTGGNFQDGWIVIADTNSDGIGDDLIRVQQKIEGKVKINQTGLATITFDGRGFLPTGSTTGTISFCDDRGAISAKTISISATGRASRRGASASCI